MYSSLYCVNCEQYISTGPVLGGKGVISNARSANTGLLFCDCSEINAYGYNGDRILEEAPEHWKEREI